MKRMLQQLTNNPVKSVFAGTLISATIQSSSVTTVITTGFLSAGLLNLAQAIGIIFGANVGTTITVQLIAFDIGFLAPVFLLFGFAFREFVIFQKYKNYGNVLLGLGLLFIAINLMKEGTYFLKDSHSFNSWLSDTNTPVKGILIGFLFSALLQSSSATIAVLIVLSSQGFIGLEQGVAIILGSNLGTCVKTFVFAFRKNRVGLQTAMAYFLFNAVGVLLFFPWIFQAFCLVHPFEV